MIFAQSFEQKLLSQKRVDTPVIRLNSASLLELSQTTILKINWKNGQREKPPDGSCFWLLYLDGKIENVARRT